VIYSEGRTGRTFVLRLEDREIIHTAIEAFAEEHNIGAAFVSALGGVDKDSVLVVGPEQGRSNVIIPVHYTLDETYEATGTGTLFRDEQGKAVLHMHLSCGRGDRAVTGCIREGVYVWQVLEVIIIEISGARGVRKIDPVTGFALLVPETD